MQTDFSRIYYPLGLQCGRRAWDETRLTSCFARQPQPRQTYFRHLLAEYLRPRSSSPLTAAELELWSVLNQVLRRVAEQFLTQRQGKIGPQGLEVRGKTTPLPGLDAVYPLLLQYFPAVPLELGQRQSPELLRQLFEQGQRQDIVLELILLYVQSRNPALKGGLELFAAEEDTLNRLSAYRRQVQLLDQALPDLDDGFPAQPRSLLERLLAPLLSASTLYEQLRILKDIWAGILPHDLLLRISGAVEEYEKEGYQPDFPGEPELDALDPATHADEEYADFTLDTEWMPRTVLLAKSTYVWLAQLSRRHHRQIRTLDQIPDAELDDLAACGFTSLWLIGIWQRSDASRKVKNLCGQLQVAASAYAIADYRVAPELGGDEALGHLRRRCRQRGIDLACDVVTNHTGIESVWLRDHPDWFIQSAFPPYPGYRFSGPDLSEDSEYAIQIEDGYFDHTEAAVVCRYTHRRTGEVRYLYHGNDGTHLPWNDTVQLNYLLPQVREAMIQLILRVARDFRIIRFDAAMTLAKRHFQRLWFPLPGSGAGVPSRGDYAMSRDEFNRHFPVEFWRELVDRVRAEVPDTLLIAEAFWLMEGYFVRTLGMHRVYNSAFMNMLKREENGKYRQTIKNILLFDPAILQRFVNFMSNPDEKPALEQFGKGDKYFCVATMLATMPGLPMFGHGQIEGLNEKYGMEYLQPRQEEVPDQQLIERHRRRLFPLLRQRSLFSGAESFQLYDFVSAYGVEEDVFAYSNRLQNRTVVVVCNNSAKSISGRIGAPVAMADKEGVDFSVACAINPAVDFVLMKDLVTAQYYLHPAEILAQGGEINLAPYAHRVLTEFAPLRDSDGRWRMLWDRHGDTARPAPFLEFDAILLEETWAAAKELLGLEAATQADPRFQALLEQIGEIYRRPQLAPMAGEYLLSILLQVLFPGTSLGPAELSTFTDMLATSSLGRKQELLPFLDRFFNHRPFRLLLSCHYYDYTDWFDKNRFDLFRLLLLQYELSGVCRETAEEPARRPERIAALLRQLSQLADLAEQVNYRVDELLFRLDQEAMPEAETLLPDPEGRKILFVVSEAAPFAKTGGLADVAGSLPRALRQLGHDVQVFLPAYRMVKSGHVPLSQTGRSVEIRLQGTTYRAALKQAVYDEVPFWFIDTPEFFDRDGLYGSVTGDFSDNGLRFGFFCRAVLEAVKLMGFQPDLIHLHDWQTGFLPALLKTSYADQEFFARTRTLLTIHNLGYQGMFPLSLLPELELTEELGTPDGMEYYGRLSILKGGINYADLLTTVSENYCRETQQPEQGQGFDGLLRSRGEHYFGIVNGLDRRQWNPETDPQLKVNYSATRLKGKALCKQALQQELGLAPLADSPLVVVISRLDRQKGIDLVEEILPQLLRRNLQFVLLGSGTLEQTGFWRRQQGREPERMAIRLSYDEAFSHRLYAAADLLLVPSRYEPCGLTQMIALTYGALPVVRRTGGLADTVIDIDADPRKGYGFVFDQPGAKELLTAVDRGLGAYATRANWKKLVQRGMKLDFSWDHSARRYDQLYQQLLSSRGGADQ